jgi:hypothetical protein
MFSYNDFSKSKYIDEYTYGHHQEVKRITGRLPGAVSLHFFDNNNIDVINKQLTDFVLVETAKIYTYPVKVNGPERPLILNIMRDIFIEYQYDKREPKVQVSYLNGLVINHFIPKLMTNIDSYFKYLRDVKNIGKNYFPLPESTRFD